MIPDPTLIEPDMLNVRYAAKNDPAHRWLFFGLPEWRTTTDSHDVTHRILHAPSREQFQEWWKWLREWNKTGRMFVPDISKSPIVPTLIEIDKVELLEGGTFNVRPVMGGDKKQRMQIIGTQVCHPSVIARLPDMDTQFEWLNPAPEPLALEAHLPEIPE